MMFQQAMAPPEAMMPPGGVPPAEEMGMNPIPGGQGFNPAMGGESPVGIAPEEEVMREMVRGEDIMGNSAMPPEF